MDKMPNRITMSDVARRAGVSLMTVSRVVNNKGEVSPETRQRIQRVIEELGYRPSGIARSLATRKTGALGLVVPDVTNPFFADIAKGVEHLAYAEGYNVFLCNTEEDPQRELTIIESLRVKEVDGLIVCSSRLDDKRLREALQHHPAVVLINRRIRSSSSIPGITTVMIDDCTGGATATRHLLQSGRRSIGFLAGPPASKSGLRRGQGYRIAYREAALTPDPDWSRYCAPNVDGGYIAGMQLLREHPELDALFCYNDLVAVGVLQACAELGLHVPDDIAVVGFDDIPLASLVTPPLTTCRVARYELGRLALIALMDQMRGCTSGCSNMVLSAELVVRASAP